MSDAKASPPEDGFEASVPALWSTARRFLCWLIEVYGTPCALAAGPWLSRRERREIRHWLLPLEALVRRLLLIEAVRVAGTMRPAGKRPRARRKRPAPFCRVNFPDPENSRQWAVRFSVVPRPRRRGPRLVPRVRFPGPDPDARFLAPAARAAAAEEHHARMREMSIIPVTVRALRPRACRRAGNPWLLARRIEALARLLENPGPHVRRLARLVRKDAVRLIEACHPPPVPPPDEPFRPGETSLRYASERALKDLAEFDPG